MLDTNLFHPERYHGHRRTPPFFEGWYYKLVDAGQRHRYAVIPGIFLSEDPDEHHAFIQILDGTSGAASYHRFPAAEFRAASARFDIHIGPNHFSNSGLSLHLEDRRISGDVRIDEPTPWPVTPVSLGIMGPYGWIPSMECNHGVVSLDHRLSGSLMIDDTTIDFTGGRGYIEKDWGKSFPAAYVWMQSNHFETPGTSFVGSIAIIPWLFSAFPGFIIGLLHHGRLHRFATYTRAATEQLAIDDDQVTWTVSNRRHRLVIRALRTTGGLLVGPTRERMGDRVGETMTSSIEIEMTTVSGERVFAGTGLNAGLEVQGDLDRLLALQRR
jgi:tocopherol cyclase